PEALAQPARFAVVFGQVLNVPVARRRVIMESALRARSGDLALLMGLGRTYDGDDRPEAVAQKLRWFQAAVSAHPKHPMARNNLGVALAQRGDGEGAIGCLEKAIECDPTFALAHRNLGAYLRQKGELVRALAAARKAAR